jgi:hypothetical protein
MNKDNKNIEVNNTDKKLHISDVMFRFIGLIPLLGGLFYYQFGQEDWFEKHMSKYMVWMISSSFISCLLILGYIVLKT